MPIFRKVVTESSQVIFDIKADTRAEAEEAFERKFTDPDMEGDYDEYRDIMNSQCNETIINLTSWNNDEEYARSGIKAPDFFIEAKKPKEPNLVIEKLTEFNKDYILKPTIPNGEAIKNSMDHGTKLIYYMCERRN